MNGLVKKGKITTRGSSLIEPAPDLKAGKGDVPEADSSPLLGWLGPTLQRAKSTDGKGTASAVPKGLVRIGFSP
jgi:hypothetical protein